jgi:hypothetical protein
MPIVIVVCACRSIDIVSSGAAAFRNKVQANNTQYVEKIFKRQKFKVWILPTMTRIDNGIELAS